MVVDGNTTNIVFVARQGEAKFLLYSIQHFVGLLHYFWANTVTR